MSVDNNKPGRSAQAQTSAKTSAKADAGSISSSNATNSLDPAKPLQNVPATADLLEAVAMRMPFGRFKGERLIDLPEPYIVWFRGQGFPAGMLGQRMALVYELKLNGLEKLIRPMLDENS